MEREPADAVRLSPHDEEEWERLSGQFHFAAGHWLGFLFSPSSYEARIVRRRVAQVVEERGGALDVFVPDSPEALRGVLPWLLSPERKEAACVWVEGFFVDLTGKDAAPWVAAWDEVMLRANERREALRRHLRGGLVFAAPVGIKPRFREAAPDVWSSRAIVVELAGGMYLHDAMADIAIVPPMPEPPVERDEGEAAPDPDFWIAEAERRPPGTADRASALVEAAHGLQNARRSDDALVALSEAVETYRHLSQARPDVFLPDLAKNLARQSVLNVSLGQRDAARPSLQEAVGIFSALTESDPKTFSPLLTRTRFVLGLLEFEQYLTRGDVHGALKLAMWLRDLAADGDNAFLSALAWYTLGRAWNSIERPAEALDPLREARQRSATLAETGDRNAAALETAAIIQQGFALLDLRQTQDAERAYEEAFRRNEERGVAADIALQFLHGMLRFVQERFEDAFEVWQSALLDPRVQGTPLLQVMVWRMLGMVYARMHRFEDAERAIQRALELARSLGNNVEVNRILALLVQITQMRSNSAPR
ncbi:tetratricopeptide repeat protein [Polyangium sorediatum]|uniref:Tetratricopeptide repeat protein n=1 Tax=Polyangium sorediatum TaxID=889274 RepID=A0ABT6NIN7_9BACT|nr:tetratricopeptide repeat protein [Polyangium sorediatum]MDI1428158.1 tetratricopeptide repeat protein [Polyangium sorediatum]